MKCDTQLSGEGMGAKGRPLCAGSVEQWISYFQVVSAGYVIEGRHDSEDCVQECCVEMIMLLDVMDPTDPNFSAELKTRVFRCLVDLQRAAFRPTHDVRRERILDDVAEQYMAAAPNVDPAEMASARDLEQVVARELDIGPQTVVWRELVAPTARLGNCLNAYRRERGINRQSVPMSVYADATGLSPRQVRHALEGIRAVAKRVFSSTDGGLRPCLS